MCVHLLVLAPMETNTLHHTLYEGVHYFTDSERAEIV